MSLSYWNKFHKRIKNQTKKAAVGMGIDFALCPKRKKQDRCLQAEPFNVLLEALIKASSNESRRTDPS